MSDWRVLHHVSQLMGPSEKRVNKRWLPAPGDVVCVACKDQAKVPSYYQESRCAERTLSESMVLWTGIFLTL